MIQNCLGDGKIDYCERLDSGKCCGEAPCVNATGKQRFAIRKTHDQRITAPQDVQNAVYVVQYRDPAPQVQSDAERLEAANLADFTDLDLARCWCAKRAIYLTDFLKKWLPLLGATVVRHDVLVREPLSVMRRVFDAVGWPLDEARMRESIAFSLSYKSGNGSDAAGAYRQRDLAACRVLPLPCIAAVDALVRSESECEWGNAALDVEPDAEVLSIYAMLRNPTPETIAECANPRARRDAEKLLSRG